MNTENNEGMDLGKELQLAEDIKANTEAQGEDDEPSIEQAFLAICNLAFEEWIKASETHGRLFWNNDEAVGAIRDEYMEVEELLRKAKIQNSQFLTQDAVSHAMKLQPELIQHIQLLVKAALSFTDIREACKKLDQKAKLAAVVSKMMANLPDEQPENETPDSMPAKIN